MKKLIYTESEFRALKPGHIFRYYDWSDNMKEFLTEQGADIGMVQRAACVILNKDVYCASQAGGDGEHTWSKDLYGFLCMDENCKVHPVSYDIVESFVIEHIC